jgi:hypothetical protein
MSVAHADSAQAATGLQGNWAWCSKCQGLYYPNSASSICPKDYNRHGQAKSFEYFVYYNAAGNDKFQTEWAWCHLCAGLFYSGGKTTNGSCPGLAGYGPHQNSGYNYCLPHDGGRPPIGYGYQIDWSFCKQCNGLFYAGPNDGGTNERAGICPLDGSTYLHNGIGSFDYWMID